MGWGYWGDFKPKKRIAVKGGLKAKGQRGSIGETWWSKRFISILESFDIGARLSRGRTYARQGQVLNLDLKPGLVSARVQGSASRPYRVTIEIHPLSEADWTQAEKAMAEQAIFLAKLLGGEMPHEIEDAFIACRLNLFPASSRDLKTECSCPDWSNPCKHIAAVYYLLAEKFDEDPFSIFAWRGRTKEQLLENLRHLRGTAGESETVQDEPDILVRTENVVPLDRCLAHFWQAGSQMADLHIQPQAAAIPDALLRQLDPLPVKFDGKDEKDVLRPAYHVMTIKAQQRALDDI